MDRTDFAASLATDGFAEIVTIERPADGALDVHTHPFEAKALVLAGELTIRCGTTEQRYQAGQIFHLAAHEPHAETYGPQGVTYLVGRK